MRVTAVSGFGGKDPACFLVEHDGTRILLDLGEGPDAGAVVDVSGVGRVDALVLGHGHADHNGGLDRLPRVGNPPIHAASPLLAALPPQTDARPLSRGTAIVAGLTVQTGRTGHAPGGLWLRFDVAGGVLYMGDHCAESPLFAYDPPPPSRLVILDASYGTDDTPLAEQMRALDHLLAEGPSLLPLPSYGRAGEIALHLARSGAAPHLCPKTRDALAWMAREAAGWLRDGTAAELADIAATAPAIDGPHGVMLAADAQCAGGMAGELARRWADRVSPAIIFTGHVSKGTPAAALVGSGRARFQRWNVHPRAAENAALVRTTTAAYVMPAFCGIAEAKEMAPLFAPATTLLEPIIDLDGRP